MAFWVTARTSLLLLCFAACASGDTGDRPPAELVLTGSRSRLDNGLEVAVVPHAGVPLVTAMLAVRSGAFIEAPDQSGYSHLLEHMMFTGTRQLPDPQGFRDQLERIGAVTNATTGGELVTYFYVLPSARLEDGLGLLSSALRDPLLDPGVLAEETRVVLAEYDLADSNWQDRQQRRLSQLLYPGQPNRFDPLGQRQVIERATSDALRRLYDTYYTPENALVLLVGDIDTVRGEQLARHYFGDWPATPGPLTSGLPALHAPLPRSVAETLRAPVSASTLAMGWQGPDPRTDFRAAVAADLLSEISVLGSSNFRSVVEAPAVLGARMVHYPSAGQGQLVIRLTIGAGFESAAIGRLRLMLQTFAASITEDELLAAKDALWATRFFGGTSDLGLAFQLAQDWSRGESDYGMRYIDTLYALERSDLADLVARYITGRSHAAVLLTSADEKANDVTQTLELTW